MTDRTEPCDTVNTVSIDNSNPKNGNVNEAQTAQTTRTRTQTDKGREYSISLAIAARKASYKKWRKQMNRLSSVMVDSEDVGLLRTERNQLEVIFNDLTTQQERLEELLENDEDKIRAEEGYDDWDQENTAAFALINSRIAEIASVNSDALSCRSNLTSRSLPLFRPTKRGVKKLVARRPSTNRLESEPNDVNEPNERRLNEEHCEKRFPKNETDDTPSRKMIEIERLRLMSRLAKAEAELNELKSVKEEHDSRHSEELHDKKDLLEDYLQTQLSSVSSANSDDESCPSSAATPSNNTKRNRESIESGNEAISRLADLLTQGQQRDHLPRPEPERFEGNLLRFPLWMKSFETLIESRTTIPSERLYYLGRYTRGEAREVIEGVLPLTTDDAYQKAKALLHERFGNPFLISDAYRKKINDWPKIQANDGPALRKFADFLETCRAATAEIKYLKVLDDPDENQKMLQKVPNYVVTGWSRVVDKWIRGECEKGGEHAYPPFTEFCRFLRTEARIACNPITSLRALKPREDGKATKTNGQRRDGPLSSFAATARVTPATNNSHARPQSSDDKCLVCNGKHSIDICEDFLRMQLNDRKEMARSKALCWGCLRQGHKSRQCKAKKTCDVCKKPHPTSLHDYDHRPASATKQPEGEFVSNRVDVHQTADHGVLSLHSLIVPVWLGHADNPAKEDMVYALLDEQSDACFVNERTLEKLGVDGTEVHIELSTVLGRETIQSKRVNGLTVRGVKESTHIQLPRTYTRRAVPAKRSMIPRPEIASKWSHLCRVANQLMPYRDDVEIGLLIGLNCINAIKPLEIISGSNDEPYAKRTALGWGVIGPVNVKLPNDNKERVKEEAKPAENKTICHFAFRTQAKEIYTTQQVSKMFERDFSERDTSERSLSVEDRRFLRIIGEGIHQLPDGHYEMPLPFRNDNVKFQNNIEMALRRLSGLKKRFQRDEKYRQDYVAFMQAVIDAGHAEPVEEHESTASDGKVWYIPHHGVYHPKKPNKIRVVFDCSAKCQGESLNRQLLQGPDLANSLVGVLCRFRIDPIAFMCDIEKMFHQVKVQKDCRDYLRFLWWENADLNSEPKIFRMTVHLFGAVSSPGCANFTLKKVADDYRKECGEGAAEFIKHDFYVDDGLKSVPTVKEAVQLINDAKTLCDKGGFHLHKFTSNSTKVIESLPNQERTDGIKNLDLDNETMPIERALGVLWCVESDTFQFRITLKDRPFTRRGILATVSSVFDPLGLVAPVILRGKRILQQLCQDGVDWDERVSDDIRPSWERWRTDLLNLSKLKVNRCFKPESFTTLKSAEMHHFSDASNDGYGQCSYLKLTDTNNQVHCSLVMAKSRVAPLRPITIPRLELSAALVSVRISQMLQKELSKLSLTDVFWTDSMIVLGYLNNEARRFHTFVSNRVQQIRDCSTPDQWHYVDTKTNPADHASRGLTASELIECDAWWNGPEFLWNPSTTPEQQSVPDVSPEDPEVKKVSCFASKVEEFPSILRRLEYFSSWYRAKRAIALCIRLQERFKRKDNNQAANETKPITRSQTSQLQKATRSEKRTPVDVNQLQQAEHVIIKELQGEHFHEEIQVLESMTIKGEVAERSASVQRKQALKKASALHRLDPFLDENGLLRVGGRLKAADIPYEEKHPLILPRKSHVTSLIICHHHERVQHQGRGITQNELRTSGYWVIGGSSVISNHISSCVKCRKLRSAPQEQKMANLPEDRLQSAPPFTYSGVDCFGPFLVKEGRKELKRYGAIFTCMASRAIHIEVLHTMETDSFINAYRRFIGRRGPVRQLRSDQGTNFKGAKNELQKALAELNHKKITDTLLKDNCDWVVFKMNVPHASHMGGVWERQIRSTRNVLSVLLDRQGTQLDDESLKTLMVEAESIVNSRPLTTESASSASPLSPNQILTMKGKVVLPPPGNFQRPDLYSRKRWRRVQYMANEFWMKWRKSFLQSLQERQRWSSAKPNIAADDIVILKEDGLPRNKWQLARVTETYPSDDGKVRKVQVAIADSSADIRGKRRGPLTQLQRPIHKLVLLYSAAEQKQDRGIPIEEP